MFESNGKSLGFMDSHASSDSCISFTTVIVITTDVGLGESTDRALRRLLEKVG